MDTVILILISALQAIPARSISTHHVRAVSARDFYHNNPLPPDKTNWEVGLKEATYQALVREQVSTPRLRDDIYASNIEGFQDTATPFGDIAVIARGQLYATTQGFQFVQDPYQNDCDDCHTPHRCDRRQCEPQTNQNLDNLLALWTVKRIRHRDPKYGHRYELQFTISPMSPAANAHFVARNGRFDYSIPGHVFIVKLKENGGTAHLQSVRNNFRFDKEHHSGSNHKELKILPWSHQQHHINNANPDEVYQNVRHTPSHYHNTPNSILVNNEQYYVSPKDKVAPTDHVYNPGFLIGISPNGYKHIIHDIPTIVAERPYTEPKHYVRPDDTTPKEPIKHYHHHFYIPEVSDLDGYDRKVMQPIQPTILTTTAKDQDRFVTNFKPTITSSDDQPKYLVTTHNIATSPKQIYTQGSTQGQVTRPITTDQGYNYRTTYKYPETTVPITINPTTIYGHTELGYTDNPIYHPRTTLVKFYTVNDAAPTQSTPFHPSPFYVQYSEPDPIYNNNQPPTVPTYIPQTTYPTVQPTAPTYVTIREQPTPTVVTVYDEESTTPVSVTTKKLKYPDSINAQLPPPEKGTDTTVPYVASTAVTIITTSGTQPTPVQNENSAENTDSTERKATTLQEKYHSTTRRVTPKSTTKIYSARTKNTEELSSTPMTPQDDLTTISQLTTGVDNIQTTTLSTVTSRESTKDSGEDILATVHIPKKTTKSKVIYSEDFDIFGPTEKTTTTVKTTQKVSTRERPNAFDEIFSDFRSSTENTNRFITPHPHTQLTINRTDALKNARISKYLKYKRNKTNRYSKFSKTNEPSTTEAPEDKSDVETKTSQSFITSISFKVNKNKQNKTENTSASSRTINDAIVEGDMYEIDKNKSEFKIYKVKMPDSIQTTTDRSQTFDDVAQTLVNHARIVSYLNSKSTKPTKRAYTPAYR